MWDLITPWRWRWWASYNVHQFLTAPHLKHFRRVKSVVARSCQQTMFSTAKIGGALLLFSFFLWTRFKSPNSDAPTKFHWILSEESVLEDCRLWRISTNVGTILFSLRPNGRMKMCLKLQQNSNYWIQSNGVRAVAVTIPKNAATIQKPNII